MEGMVGKGIPLRRELRAPEGAERTETIAVIIEWEYGIFRQTCLCRQAGLPAVPFRTDGIREGRGVAKLFLLFSLLINYYTHKSAFTCSGFAVRGPFGFSL